MLIPRRHPITLEQAVLRCGTCNTDLAIIESLGDTITTTYLWRPLKAEDGSDILSPCHRKGVSDAQAIAAYRNDRCDQYWQDTIIHYHWPDRDGDKPTWDAAEPVLDDYDEQPTLFTEGAP